MPRPPTWYYASPAQEELRRQMIQHICTALRNRKPDVAQPWLHILPRFAAKLETFLFLISTSSDEYADTSTIAPRLQRLARVLKRRFEPSAAPPAVNMQSGPSADAQHCDDQHRQTETDPNEEHANNSWQWSDEDHDVQSNREPWEEESHLQSEQSCTQQQEIADHEACTHELCDLEAISSTHNDMFQDGEPATNSAPFMSDSHSGQEGSAGEMDLEAGPIKATSDELDVEADKTGALASSGERDIETGKVEATCGEANLEADKTVTSSTAAEANIPVDHASAQPDSHEPRGADDQPALKETHGNDGICYDGVYRPTKNKLPVTTDVHEADSHGQEHEAGEHVADTASAHMTRLAPQTHETPCRTMREQHSPTVFSSTHGNAQFHGGVDPTASGPLTRDDNHAVQKTSPDGQDCEAAHSNASAAEAFCLATHTGATKEQDSSSPVLKGPDDNSAFNSADEAQGPRSHPNAEKRHTDHNDALLFRRRSHWPSASAREIAEKLLLSGNHADALEVVFRQVTLEAQPTVLTSLANLAKRQGKYDAALAANGALVDSAESVHLAAALSARGDLLYYVGRLAEAQIAYERALEVRERVYAPGHETTFNVLNNIGVVAELQGDTTKAKESYQAALEIKNDDAVRTNLFNLMKGAPSENKAAILDEPSYMTLERPSTVPTNASRRQRPGARVLREHVRSDARSHPKPPNAPRRGPPPKHNRNKSSYPSRATTRPATSTGLRGGSHLGARR